MVIWYPGEEPVAKPKPEDEESEEKGPAEPDPAPVAPPEVHPGPRVLYTVGEPPRRRPDAVMLRDRPDDPNHWELVVRTRAGGTSRWAWEVTAGSYELLDSNRIRFTPPADAAPGSVFRITARAAVSSSSASQDPVYFDIVLP